MIRDLEELTRTLQPAFTEQQTNTLATSLYEYCQPIVHQREMAAIRDTLGRAAAIQDRTDERLERITATLDRTEERFDRLTAVDERIELQLDRLAVAGEESNRRIDRLATAQESTRADIEHLAEITKEVVWGIGDLRKQFGGITISVDQGLEAYAMERIPTLLEQQFGYQTKSAMPEFLGPDGDTSEIDVVYRGRHEGRLIAEYACILAFPRGIVAS